jgi:tetratricopeptide (TPR) repeat protein
VEELGGRSGAPACSLYDCLTALARNREAFQVLGNAIERRPADMQLVLFTAQALLNHGRLESAKQLLAKSKQRAKRSDWLAVRAELARAEGDSCTALRVSLKLAEEKTYDIDLQAAAIELVEQLEDAEETRTQIETMMARAPHYLPIQRLGIERLGRLDREAAILKLEDLLSRHPHFAWGQREIALQLTDAGRPESAKPHSEQAIHLDPSSASSHGIHARVLRELGDLVGARAAYQQALRLDADYGMAIHELIELAENQRERLAALDFVREQLKNQVVYGEGLLAYRAAARSVVDADQVLPLLRETLTARPDLRAAWSETVQQLVEMGDLDAALELARSATERFSLVADSWFELAQVQQSRRDNTGRIEALERATTLAPSNIQGHCDLADAYQTAGHLEDAERVLVQLIGRAPRHTACYAFLADLYSTKGDYDAAVVELEKALRLEAGYSWAWNQHREWSSAQGRPQATGDFARTLTRERPEDFRAWLALAEHATDSEAQEERLAASERALALAPRDTDAHIARIRLLTEAGRFDEAMAACEPDAFGNSPPVALRGHAAWVLAERGQRGAAIERLRSIVESDSSYLWGWQMLCGWYRDDGNLEKVEEACMWLTRLDPRSSNGWSNLAQCQLESGRRHEALESLTQAVEREPDYGWAVFNLFDLHLERDDFDEAERVLAGMIEHVGGPMPCAQEVSLALKRGDNARAQRSFRALCERPDSSETAIQRALDAYTEAGFEDTAMQLLEDAARSESCSAPAACSWAEVCKGRRDRQGHCTSLEKAYELDPSSEATARRLADAYQNFERFDDARRVLDASLARTPEDPDTLAHLADLHWAMGDSSAAISTMEQALSIRPDLRWCWSTLAHWGRSLERPELSREIARKLAQERPKDLSVRLNLVHQCDFSDGGEERIEACRGAISIAPFDAEVHDLLIVTLAEAGRLDEATAACDPEVFGDELPSQLRARAAWLHDLRGSRESAISEMLSVAQRFPQETFAWECLDEWYEEGGDRAARLRAAAQCASKLPNRADVLRRLGSAQEAAGELESQKGRSSTVVELRTKAKASYARALDLSPGYTAAFCDAFDLHFSDGELDRASALLTAYLPHNREEFGLARAVQLCTARGNRPEALNYFAELCDTSVEYPWPVRGAWEALQRAGWHTRAFKQLQTQCERGELGSQAAACYARACAQSRRPARYQRSLIALFQQGELGVTAAVAYMEEAPASKQLEQIRNACGDLFLRDTRVWAAYGEALMRQLRDRDVCRWMADWRNRQGVDSSALGTLAASLRRLDRWPQAARIATLGLERSSGPEAYSFSLWLALDAALKSDLAVARARLKEVNPAHCNDYFDALRRLVEACLAAMGDGQHSSEAGFAAAKAEIKRVRPSVSRYHKHNLKCLSLAYTRALRCIAQARGGLGARLWAWWARHRALS